ncbi:hypothetical protein CLV98_10550 [Dyadobacter jejuensis]|uniref:Uncharacterized protein n=1 Tax=Dyadobacter jejuensis TaxID=1082580 RepID=A0A316AM46_9BACT|nr:DUF6252 family protein [Dyadobacter jejuensis]PWJ57870.1 hypothetical protein CLV98_10550 [Dyadobacter jejuensis]
MRNLKNTSLYAFTLAIWLTTISCDKGPHLTPITQEGKNTFSCKVNGKVWVPTGKIDFFATLKPINGGFFQNAITDSIGIYIRAYSDSRKEVHLFLSSRDIGIKDLNLKTAPSGPSLEPDNYGLYRKSAFEEYITSSINTGHVNLTVADIKSGIIAGTFEFTAADPKGNLVKITEGRFDIKSPL